MTTQEAAEALGIDRSGVLRLIRHGRLPAEKHGRDWWIKEIDLEAFKAQPRPVGRPRNPNRQRKTPYTHEK